MEERPARARRRIGALGVLVGALAVFVLLVAWNKAASSPRLCASCHAMDDAVSSAGDSVHAEVSCLACHKRPGVLGALGYIPDLARESVQEVTGLEVTEGILEARTCRSCHDDLTSTGALAQAHGEEGPGCATCHGNAAHPRASPAPPPDEGHPEGYSQTHGRDATEEPASCTTCHQQQGFCTACHFRTRYPHPQGWMTQHGGVQEKEGAQACSLCHAPTFCVACHGTEIPHAPTWLGEHYRALQGVGSATCTTCHVPRDCALCHARHDVHREQDLYG